MLPIDFPMATCGMQNNPEPWDMPFVYFHAGFDGAGRPHHVTVWKPSKEDIEDIVAGKPLVVITLGAILPVMNIQVLESIESQDGATSY